VPILFARLKGRNGKVREYEALVDSAASYCIMPKVDAYALGYGEAIQDPSTDFITRPANLMTVATFAGYLDAPLIRVDEVSLGGQVFRNVEFLAYDLPQEAGFDVVLGASLLSRAKVKLDMSSLAVSLGD
jgi:predicted aspartyl protease